MTGVKDLPTLLRHLEPCLSQPVYVFATLPNDAPLPADLAWQMMFREHEGLTLVLEEGEARRAGLAGTFRCRMLTLRVNSSLEAVGLIATVSARLAASGIPMNPVSAYRHDHVFVPVERADDALRLLLALAAEAGHATLGRR
ncbi:MAG TPA: ACT domain-containing protein [Stellaceae bacterium]|nr:ACT domain-containing protein [Stellaceae bacterium]